MPTFSNLFASAPVRRIKQVIVLFVKVVLRVAERISEALKMHYFALAEKLDSIVHIRVI